MIVAFITLISGSLVCTHRLIANSNEHLPNISVQASINIEVLDEIKKCIEENHPAPYTKLSKKTFEKQISHLKKIWHKMSEDEKYFSLRKLCSLGDAHTTILRNQLDTETLPFFILPYGKHSIIVQAEAEYTELLGKEVLEINGHKIDSIFKSMLPFISYDMIGWARLRFHYECRFVYILKHLKIVKNDASKATVKYKDIKSGKIKTAIIPFSQNFQINEPKFAPLAPSLFQVGYYRALALQDVLFIQYNVCSDAPEMPMKDFALQIGNVASNFKKIIIDLRHNAGGNSEVILPLIEVLKNISEKKLFAIVGGGTFSSGVMAASALKEIGAIIIGENVGWDGKFGEVKSFHISGVKSAFGSLPSGDSYPDDSFNKSSFTLSISTKDFSSIKSLSSLHPDILMSQDLRDLANGQDTIVEYIKNVE